MTSLKSVLLTSKNIAWLLLLTTLAFLVQGYHPGWEDDGVYLSAIKKQLHPQLYPYDSDFFQVQLQATIFDKLIAQSIRLSSIPLATAVLIWQLVAIFLVLWGSWQISRKCFAEAHAQWAAVSMVACLLTLPVSGSGLYLIDQHLHPRSFATAAILGAVVVVVENRRLLASVLLVIAFVLHPIMAAFGISYCFFLAYKRPSWLGSKSPQWRSIETAAFFVPLGWIFEPCSDAWRQAASTRSSYLLQKWEWYELLGAVAPLALLWWFSRVARRNRSPVMEHIALRLVLFGLFQFTIACLIMLPPSLERLRPLQPMRFLHLVYWFLLLMAGGLIGRYVLRRHVYRWLLLFAPLAAAMFYAQRQTLPSTEHLELPGRPSTNAWVEAFDWVRQNTPTNSLFALDPYYMMLSGEDYHSFRALAERSALADYVKDPAVVTQVPRLAERWQREVNAGLDWRNFEVADFRRLRRDFGVNWVVLAGPGVPGIYCPYQSTPVLVCRLE